MNTRLIGTAAGMLLVLGALAGCGLGATVAGSASPQPPAALAAQAQTVAPVALVVTASATLGGIVADGEGRTLYRFDKDTAKPPKSNCENDCATTWPPLITTTPESVQVTGVDEALVGTVSRADGSAQVTIAGWPVYRYSKDTAPGDIKGQGVGGTWFAVTPQGKKATDTPATTVALVVMKVAPLGPIVTDRQGMTLYRFDNDTAKPSKSNCDGDCAKAWPPVLTSSSTVQVDGIDPALVGTVTRSDGSLQVTVAGWPVYHFANDKVPCDIKGQGVGGTWFALTAQGKKAGV